jgi:hypothetical protein
MKTEHIIIHEVQSHLNLLANYAVTLVIAIGSIISVFHLLTRVQLLSAHLIIFVLVGIGVMPTAVITWILSLRKQVKATPILHVKGSDAITLKTPRSTSSTEQRHIVPQIISAISPSSRLPANNQDNKYTAQLNTEACITFTLCEEGLVLYRSGSARLVRWDRIRYLKANHDRKRFEFTIKKTLGRDSILVPERFDEIRQMISGYFPVR